MADVDYDDLGHLPYEPAPHRSVAGSQRLLNIAGAVSSVALVIGVAVWGYQIAVRDVRGVPVLRALEGPLRVAPENPGGEIALHQGLAVNNVAELGTAAPPPDRLLLAPRAEELSPDDTAGLTTAVAVAPPDEAAGKPTERIVTPPPAPLIAAPAPVVEDPETSVADTTSGDPLAEEGVLPEPAPVVLESAPPPSDTVETAAAPDPLLENPAPLPTAVARSLVPRPRPGSAAAAPDAAAAAAPAARVDPANLKIGEQLVQLGAFDDEAQAQAEWEKLATRFGDLMAGKALVLQSAQSGGRTFFRLRAQGFADSDDARRFCSALVAEEASCIPVVNR